MFDYRVTFVAPLWLLLLAALPLLWWYSWRALRLMGRFRRLTVISLRTVVFVLIVAALAEIQTVRISNRLTVIYLLDQSMSIPVERRHAMVEYVNAAIRKHWQYGDRTGVIVFGRDAAIEVPPFDEPVQMLPQVESPLDAEFTNIAAALKLAKASFPEDAAKRIVVISDGNENLGNALEQAQAAASVGIGIDAAPVSYQSRAEVAVERVIVPEEVRRGQPFDLRVVVNNTTEPTQNNPGEVAGRLVISQSADGQPVVLSDEPVVLPPGKRVFTIRQQIESANFYTYEARFVPDRPEDDGTPQNNRATAFTHFAGKGHVLLLENFEFPGQHSVLIESLRKLGLEVTLRKSNDLFAGLPELQPFDAVVLGNVPRDHFEDDQVAMLKLNTQQMGAGLVMLGGEHSFGAGGWAGSELEEAMPVDMQIKSAKVVPRGALVMIMHACEIPEGNHWQKVVAREAIKTLGSQDYCGLLHWNGTEQWMWARGLSPVGENRQRMLARLDQMTPGDMPQFDPTMKMAARGFAAVTDAAVRHMIIISDGDPAPPAAATRRELKRLNVTVSTVAIGAHGPAESKLLSDIATELGGKYYQVTNNKALPRIFQREARRVARPLIWNERPFQPQITFPHEMIGGASNPLPPLKAFVLTSRKDSSLVERVITAPVVGDDNNTILAGWPFGLGKGVAFTADAGAYWATDWVNQPSYDILPQMIRWSMRPVGGDDKFTTATEYSDGRVRVIVNALTPDDEFLNYLNLAGVVVGPDHKSMPVQLHQVAPGRYETSFAAKDAGSYLVNVTGMRPNEESAADASKPKFRLISVRTGVNVPYSDEFRDRTPNEALVTQMAATEPRGGSAGEVIEGRTLDEMLAVNSFRHDLPKARSSTDIWHYIVLLACCVFLADVFCRRVQVGFGWLPPLLARARDLILRREPAPAEPEFMERLRSRKAQVGGQIDQIRTAARFETEPERPVDTSILAETPPSSASSAAAPPPPKLDEPVAKGESYTERLLKAKKKARPDKDDR
jgi:Mg-chelatase subunit ChlD